MISVYVKKITYINKEILFENQKMEHGFYFYSPLYDNTGIQEAEPFIWLYCVGHVLAMVFLGGLCWPLLEGKRTLVISIILILSYKH